MYRMISCIVMLSLGSAWASSSTSDLAENPMTSQHTWIIQETGTRGLTAADMRGKFSNSHNLNFKRTEWWSPEAHIPSAPYDLSDYHESYLPPKHLRNAWDAAYVDNHHVIAHGFSASRLSGIFQVYFSELEGSKPVDLSAQNLLELAPFCALELRNIISGCLIDLRQREHRLIQYYQMGFLFKAPKECICAYSNEDLYLKSEGVQSVREIRSSIEDLYQAKYSHQELLDMLTPEQRSEYLKDGKAGITRLQIRTHKYRPVTDYWQALFELRHDFKGIPKKLKYKWDNFTPQELVSSTTQLESNYNEVAFVPRVANPHQEARLVGVYYTSKLCGFGMEIYGGGLTPIRDPLSREQTIDSLKHMAVKMGVPLIELN